MVGGRALDHNAASTCQMACFETMVLKQPPNVSALIALPGKWIGCVGQTKPIKKLILDLDSSVNETDGRQQGPAFDGHFRCECYHQRFCFN